MINPVTWLGIGKGVGLLVVYVDDRLRRHYNPEPPPAETKSVEFFPVEYIPNLKMG